MADQPTVETRSETLDCFDGSGTPMTTVEVADCLDIGRRSAYDRLDRLADQGDLESKKVGASGRVWWQPGGSPDTTSAGWPNTDDTGFDDILNHAEVGIFVLNREFEVVRINEATERYFGIEAEQVRGADKRTVVTETIASALADEERFTERVLATYDDNTYTEQFECRVTPAADRTERWLEHRSKPIESGPLAGGRIELYYDITGRKRSELARKQQREQLTALNDLNGVVRDITHAAIAGVTRAEIEQTVCDRLADSDLYPFAWIGDVDSTSETVEMRANAGIVEPPDDLELAVDVDGDGSGDPVSSAIQTGVTHATQCTEDDCLQGRFAEYDCHSAVAIPIVHQESSYGVLTLYSRQPGAFSGPQQDVIEHLGEVVGHAIAATERKQALMSDEVTELEFVIPDIFGGPEGTAGTITLDSAIQLADDEFLVYGTATADAVDSVTTLVETHPHWTAVSVTEADEATTFELRLSEPPVLSTIAAAGGSMGSATIEDGDYRLTIRLPPSVAATRISDALEALYPTVRMCRRQQISRDDELAYGVRSALAEDLTESQVQSLETAYHAGFFEWPRTATGEEIADTLGIAPSTFHYHLREGNRKVLEKVFSGGTTAHS